jgi:hypothetical protein
VSHTPGPWKVWIDADDRTLHVITKAKPGFEIAWINGGREEAEANARAIAALPDLLSAAQALSGGCNHLPERNCVHRRRLDKVLAKLKEGAGT